ncbi:DUF1758 domain-containing protein [Trichonephila clavipes]|nr:DUF1758 domain-containing protein [Trichonephila clavipes]
MIDVCNEVLRNFKTLGLECNQLVELLLVFSLQDKLEDSIKVKWELTLEDKNFPSLNKFLSFLEKQARSLQGNHNVSSCKFTTSCRACKQRHHTVLHQFQSSPREIPVSNSNQNLAATSDQNVVQPLATSQEQFCLAGQMNYSNSILLSTAIVRVKNSQGQYVNCRALIDGGSQTSLITESCSKNFNLPFYESENTILGLDNKVAAYATKRVELQLSPHFSVLSKCFSSKGTHL